MSAPRRTAPAGGWLLREPDPGARARVFCLPVSGMGATVYRQWPSSIGDVEVCLVQLPGRENRMREAGYDSMEAFAEDAAAALGGLFDRPYALFGHCLGGRLGYALALAAERRGLPAPVRLLASSCLAPDAGGRFGPFLPEMTDEQYQDGLARGCLARGEPVPHPELLAITVRVLRRDVALSCGYAPAGPTGKPLAVTTIGWTDDQDVRPDQLGRWQAYGPLRQVVLDGDEHTFRTAPEQLRQLIADELAPACVGATP